MHPFFEIFISVFFLFGLYCAALESWKMLKQIYRFIRSKNRRRIDKQEEKR